MDDKYLLFCDEGRQSAKTCARVELNGPEDDFFLLERRRIREEINAIKFYNITLRAVCVNMQIAEKILALDQRSHRPFSHNEIQFVPSHPASRRRADAVVDQS